MFKKLVFCWSLQGQRRKYQDPDPDLNLDPDPLVRGMDPRIRIHTKKNHGFGTLIITSTFFFLIACFSWCSYFFRAESHLYQHTLVQRPGGEKFY
jgi:hypothetical protein